MTIIFEPSWHKKIKTMTLSPENERVRVEMSAIDIVRAPNRHQVEAIISALCACVAGLVEAKELEIQRITDLQRQMAPTPTPGGGKQLREEKSE